MVATSGSVLLALNENSTPINLHKSRFKGAIAPLREPSQVDVIIAELKSLSSPDTTDLPTYYADGEFAILVEAEIGERGREGGDLFSLTVASTKWIEAKVLSAGGLLPRAFLIVSSFDYRQVWDTLERYCRRCTGESWDIVARQLSRVMLWEFEDYRER